MVTRFVVSEGEGPAFEERAQAALAALAARPGHRAGRLARAADDPTAWLVLTDWDSVGAYRRALSSYDVKVVATPLLSMAREEPSAFEVLYAVGPAGASVHRSDRADPASG